MPRTPVMSVANEARDIARELIPEHHVHLLLAQAEILYVFTDQQRKRCDRLRLGSAAKLSSLQRFLASGLDGVDQGPDFVILLDSNLWDVSTRAARTALVDHELAHCALFVKDETQKPAFWRHFDAQEDIYNEVDHEYRWGMRGHDIEEFAEVLYRHGFWRTDPQEQLFKAVAIQLVLPAGTNGSTKPASNGTSAATRTSVRRTSDGVTVGR